MDLEHYDSAITSFTAAIELNPDAAFIWCYRGAAHQNSGKSAEAVDDLTEAIRLEPNFALAYEYRGIAHYSLGQLDDAIQDFTKSLNLGTSKVCNFHRGKAYLKKGNLDLARTEFDEAIRLDDSWSEAFAYRGNVHHRQKVFEKAIDDYTKAIELSPNDHHLDGTILANRSLCHAALGDRARADLDLAKAKELGYVPSESKGKE